jgi:hypothetical protein
MTAPEVHKQLQVAFEALEPIFRGLESDMRADTAFAIGELTGFIAKVKALVGRDIDDATTPKPNAFETLKGEYWRPE